MHFKTYFSESEEYKSFRSNVPLRKIHIDEEGRKVWQIYDFGPRDVQCPLVCLTPVCGTADCYFRQILPLSAKGMRVLSIDYPAYWRLNDWCTDFRKVLDILRLDQVHIFGASLGGFLGQKFAEYTYNCSRVASLILCNTFVDTKIFDSSDFASLFWLFPSSVLKRFILNKFPRKYKDLSIAYSIDFMVERIPITILDVFDDSPLSASAKEEIYKCYPNARVAHMKTGGNFPFLSRPNDVNLYIQVHLREFQNTKLTSYTNSSEVLSSAVS